MNEAFLIGTALAVLGNMVWLIAHRRGRLVERAIWEARADIAARFMSDEIHRLTKRE